MKTAALTLALGACAPLMPARNQARAVVLTLSEGVRLADSTCAALARERTDERLADTCAHAYVLARAALITAAGSVDAWDVGSRSDVACAVQAAAKALAASASAIAATGERVPTALRDALTLAPVISGVCK